MDAFLCSCAPFRFVCQSTDPSEYHLCPNLHLNGRALIWSERGTGTAGASYFSPSPPTMSIFSIRKEDCRFQPYWHHRRAIFGLHIEHRTSSLLLLWSRRFISSIFRNVCRVGVFSQVCLSSHIIAGVFADTVVKEERMSGMTLHSAVLRVSRLSAQRVMPQSSCSNSDSIM